MARHRFALALALMLALACQGQTEPAPPEAEAGPEAAAEFAWPSGPRDHALIEVRDFGRIRIALFPELAPATVENFEKLADRGFYDGTGFHRVIPGFVVQGGDPNTKDDDPRNDGDGHPGYWIRDEFSDAPHLRGVVSMANKGRPHTSGSQFFIVHQDDPSLDGRYSVFGRVVEGMDVVDAITAVPIDTYGRRGLADRPIDKVEVERVWIERREAR